MASVAALALISIGCSSSSDDDPTYRIKTRRSYDKDGVLYNIYNYKYDSEGKYSGNNQTDGAGVSTGTQKYTYGSPYGYTESFAYNADGEMTGHWRRTYNASGKMAVDKSYDADDILLSTSTPTYDDAGKKTRTDIVYESGDTAYYLYEYNADGQRTKRTSYYNDNLSGTFTYTYTDGRWSRHDYYGPDGVTTGHAEFEWEEGEGLDNIVSTYASIR